MNSEGKIITDEDVAEVAPSPAPRPGCELPGHLQDLTDRARGYVEAASSLNTRKAYASDWKHFSAWCRRSNLSPLPPHPQTVGLYRGQNKSSPKSYAKDERNENLRGVP